MKKYQRVTAIILEKCKGKLHILLILHYNIKILKKSLETVFYYNVQGKTLSIVSMNANPDVFTSEFHSLNSDYNTSLKIQKRI